VFYFSTAFVRDIFHYERNQRATLEMRRKTHIGIIVRGPRYWPKLKYTQKVYWISAISSVVSIR